MIKYEIKLDTACTEFSLYADGEFLGSERWVGDLLGWIAAKHHVNLNDCISESQALHKINSFAHGKYYVEVEDD